MAKDNNNINTDDLTDGGHSTASSSTGTVATSTAGGKVIAGATVAAAASVAASTSATGDSALASVVEQTTQAPVVTPAEPPVRREENPFSFKHFLKWDGPVGGGSHYNHTINGVSSTGLGVPAGSGNSSSSGNSINHSRSTSNINGHGSSSTFDAPTTSNGANGATGAATIGTGGSIGQGNGLITTATTGSPSKSATTSSLNVVSSTTGARPKIPQFQSVNTLSSESKMKRSPRFPSFDSQSSLSDFADDRFGTIYQSRSNSSFSSDYPPASVGGGSGACLGAGLRGGTHHASNGNDDDDDAEMLGRGYVPRSYSNYDLDSPGSAAVGTDRRHEQETGGGGSSGGRLVGATEFSAALPDFVQDHLVMEQWYNTLPKGGNAGGGGSGVPSGTVGGAGAGGGGSGSSGSVDFDDMFELAGAGGNSGSIINDIPFDLTASSTGSGRIRGGRTDGHRNSPIIPLDLPPLSGGGGGVPEIGLDLPHRRVTPTPCSAELPPDLTEGNAGTGLGDVGLGGGPRSRPYYYSASPPQQPPVTVATGSSTGTSDKIHRLPDFLSDGPIHSSGRLADVTHDTPHGSDTAAAAASDHRQRLQQRQREAQYQSRLEAELSENERLRRELDQTRQTVGVQARRIRELERDLESMVASRVASVGGGGGTPSGNGGSTQSNANSFLRAKSRAATAEAELRKLQLKMSSMSIDMEMLRKENDALKEEICGAAVGGSGAGAGASAGAPRQDDGSTINQRPRRDRSSAFLRAQTIALRQAASSAESNLRQLLRGVENLQTMANQLESFNANAQEDDIDTGTAIPLEDYLNLVDIHRGDANDDDDEDEDDEDDALGPAL